MPVGLRGEVKVFGERFHLSDWASNFLRGGPRVWLAGFDEGEDCHQQCQCREAAVAKDCLDGERFGGGKAAAINLQAQRVRAHHGGEEAQRDQRDDGGPDAQTPADEQEETESDFREGQSTSNERYAPGREKLVGINLQSEEHESRSNGWARMHDGQENLGVTCVNEYAGEDQAANPDDRATEIEWAGLHHFCGLSGLQNQDYLVCRTKTTTD